MEILVSKRKKFHALDTWKGRRKCRGPITGHWSKEQVKHDLCLEKIGGSDIRYSIHQRVRSSVLFGIHNGIIERFSFSRYVEK